MLAWSQATIAGLTLDDFARFHGKPLTESDRRRIDEQVRRAAYSIIAGKGATYFGIGSAVARIVDVVLHDQRAILTICSCIAGGAGLRRRDDGIAARRRRARRPGDDSPAAGRLRTGGPAAQRARYFARPSAR